MTTPHALLDVRQMSVLAESGPSAVEQDVPEAAIRSPDMFIVLGIQKIAFMIQCRGSDYADERPARDRDTSGHRAGGHGEFCRADLLPAYRLGHDDHVMAMPLSLSASGGCPDVRDPAAGRGR